MGLSLYNQKRHFNKTKEPEGKTKSSKGALKFVVQKHDASHLHYDFRLEMDGVLKSWAVPKGPSLNPEDKRLAMHVEDHPFDYRTFEGIIPAGEYGGGTVIVWDEGTYEPMNADGLSRAEQQKLLLKQFYAGDLKIRMHGKKLNGDFALFRMKARGDNTWLLVKKNDDFATTEDIRQENQSVKTGRTLSEVAKDHGTEVNHPGEDIATTKSTKAVKRTASLKNTVKKKDPEIKSSIKDIIGSSFNSVSKKSIPKDITPMMAVLVDEAFDNEKWIFEIKWDGYRAVAFCQGEDVTLKSRNKKSFTQYAPVAEELRLLNLRAVLDGEIVAVNEQGFPDFQLLQNWQNTPAQLQYYIFDLLWIDGYDLTALPLVERKRILQTILPDDNPTIRYSDHIIGEGKNFFQLALEKGLEGIMAKKADSAYKIGNRSNDWLKIKVNKRQEVVIAGFTKPRNSREYFGALLLGVYDENNLIYVGHTGSGFTAKSLKETFAKLNPLITDRSPFKTKPKTNQPATWVKPELVCEIKFSEWTKEGIARHPIFMGLRADKKAKEVKMEQVKDVDEIADTERPDNDKPATGGVKKRFTTAKKNNEQTTAKKTAKKKVPTQNTDSVPQLDLSENDQKITINGQELSLTNLNKLYWKKEGFTKGDMLNYYLKIASVMLPYMLDRPQSLNRHPNGIAAHNFFQKNMEGKVPDWIQTHADFSQSNQETIQYLVCKDEATLIYMANLGCIEMNPWHSRTQTWEYPDWCLIDLDPGDSNTFEQVIEVAHAVKNILDAVGADSYPKTSGSSGIHIFVPLGAKYTYDQSKQLAELVVNLVHQELPSFTSVLRNPAKRKGKIYLDFLQNRQIQTVAAPYSLRPKPGVPVSTPLYWEEVKKGLTPKTYTAYNIFDKLKADGDPFKPVLGKGIDMKKVLEKVQAVFG